MTLYKYTDIEAIQSPSLITEALFTAVKIGECLDHFVSFRMQCNTPSLLRNVGARQLFLIFETVFVLFLVVLENSVLPMGLVSSHAMLKVPSEL